MLEGIRIIEIPRVSMVSSGPGSMEALSQGKFDRWFSARKDFTPQDFMWFDPERNALVWYYALTDTSRNANGAGDANDFEIVDFDGGLYAAAVSVDNDDTDGGRVYAGIQEWVAQSGCFELDERPGHYSMFHVITPPAAYELLGYRQLEIFVPIKASKR